MKRILAVFAALAAIAVVVPSTAQQHDRQLLIEYQLRASGGDVAVVCAKGPSDSEIPTLVTALQQVLPLPRSVSVRSGPARGCRTLVPRGPLTHAGLRYQRTLRFSLSLRNVLPAEYTRAVLVVCTPLLSDTVRVFSGAQPVRASHCKFGGYAWDALQPIDTQISFSATGTDLARGAFAALSWIIALGTLVAGASLFAGRNYHWRPFRRHRFLSFVFIAWLSAVAFAGWVQVAYLSHLIHALQVRAGVGRAGEILLVTLPAMLSAAAIALTGAKVAHDASRFFPGTEASEQVSEPSFIPSLPNASLPGDVRTLPVEDTILAYPSPPQRAGRLLLLSLFPTTAFLAAYIMFAVHLGLSEIKVEGMIATLLAYAYTIPFFAMGMLPHVYGARPMEQTRADAILRRLHALGAREREIYVSPVPPAVFPYGGAVLSASRRATIWEPLTSMTDGEIAGAIALRATHKRAWPSALVALIATIGITLPSGSGGHIPLWVLIVPLLLLCGTGLLDVLTLIRVRDAASKTPDTEALIRGLLTAARSTARLAAAGALGLADVQSPNYAVGTWTRALKAAEMIAKQAGMLPTTVARIADEIRWDELRSVTGAPAEDPVVDLQSAPPIPTSAPTTEVSALAMETFAPVKRTAVKKTVAKKTVTKKTVVKKTVTHRAPERSARRPRP